MFFCHENYSHRLFWKLQIIYMTGVEKNLKCLVQTYSSPNIQLHHHLLVITVIAGNFYILNNRKTLNFFALINDIQNVVVFKINPGSVPNNNS